MPWRYLLLVPLAIACLPSPSSAGPFHRSPKPDPATRVPQLVSTLKNDPDEGKRADAAKELSNYEYRDFPEVLPTLLAALKKDSSTNVRVETARTLGDLHPVPLQAGEGLEQAEKNDPAWRVRTAARSALLVYMVKGYRASRPETGQGQTIEPPLADFSPRKPGIVPVAAPLPTPIGKPAPRPAGPILMPSVRPDSTSPAGTSGRLLSTPKPNRELEPPPPLRFTPPPPDPVPSQLLPQTPTRDSSGPALPPP